MAKLPVKFYTSDDVGIGKLNLEAGSLVSVLDAILVTGFNVRPCRGVTIDAGIATLMIDGGHGYKVFDVIQIDGAMPAEANGEYRVKTSEADRITFDCQVAISSVASATIKRAALGWTTAFTGTNVRAYRPDNPAINTTIYQVSDLSAAHDGPILTIFERQTGIDAGINKWASAIFPKPRSATQPWQLIGDGRAFYWFIQVSDDNSKWFSYYGYGVGEGVVPNPDVQPENLPFCLFRNGSWFGAIGYDTSTCAMPRKVGDFNQLVSPIVPTTHPGIVLGLHGSGNRLSHVLTPTGLMGEGALMMLLPGFSFAMTGAGNDSDGFFKGYQRVGNTLLHLMCRDNINQRDIYTYACGLDLVGPWR